MSLGLNVGPKWEGYKSGIVFVSFSEGREHGSEHHKEDLLGVKMLVLEFWGIPFSLANLGVIGCLVSFGPSNMNKSEYPPFSFLYPLQK